MTGSPRPVPHPPHPDALALRSKVPAQFAGSRLLDYLCQRFPYHDRTQWLQEVAQERVHVGGRPATAHLLLAAGAGVTYYKTHREPRVNADIRVLHREPGFLVASKPAHLPMHADGPFVRHTFVHLLGEQLGIEGLQLVHRLDRETSGVLVVATNRSCRVHLGAQFESGQVEKSYLAIVRGGVAAGFQCTAAIGHAAHSEIALRRSAAPDAREAVPAHTHFDLLASTAQHSLLRCRPRTGRTHQIRVHLELAGVPLFGDKLYGRPDADYLAFVHRVKAGGDAREVPLGEPDRQLLHAHELVFAHPETGVRLRFSAPVPADFADWQDRLGLTPPPAPDPQARGSHPPPVTR